MADLSWIGILMCGIASMLLGGLYYSPLLFGKVWQAGAGLGDEELARGNMAMIYGLAFLLSLGAAILFALLMGDLHGLVPWTAAGAAAGALVAAGFGINYLFERRSVRQWLINAGYHFLQFTLFGLILGLLV